MPEPGPGCIDTLGVYVGNNAPVILPRDYRAAGAVGHRLRVSLRTCDSADRDSVGVPEHIPRAVDPLREDVKITVPVIDKYHDGSACSVLYHCDLRLRARFTAD